MIVGDSATPPTSTQDVDRRRAPVTTTGTSRGFPASPGPPRALALGRVPECGEGGVESPLAASVGLVVGFGRREPHQLVQVVIGGGQDEAVPVEADPEHQSFAFQAVPASPARRRPDNRAQVVGHAAIRTWCVLGEVQEVAQVGDQHRAAL